MTDMDRAHLHHGNGCTCRGHGLSPEALGNSPIPVWDSASHQEVCNRCGCAWTIELMGEPNRKQEWCKEVDRLPAACFCHDGEFAADFLARMDRLAIAAETVVGYIELALAEPVSPAGAERGAMSTTTRNEAAERLDHLIGQWSSPATKASLRAALDEALTIERKAMVERIRADLALAFKHYRVGETFVSAEALDAILDEEAAR